MRHLTLLLAWPLAVSAQTAKPEQFSIIEGRVINAATGEPVGKASLRLMRSDADQGTSDWARSYSTFSDSTGNFAFRNVNPGMYRLRVSRNGFVALEYGARGSQGSGVVLDCDGQRQLKDVDIRLTPHGVVAGHVLDADGEPLEGAQVQLLRSQYVNGKKVLATMRPTYSNDLGEYRLSGLAPGKYYIYAENFEGLAPSSEQQEEYVPMYYPGATDAAGAAPLDVTAGAQLRAVDIMLRRERTATVKGRVVVRLPGASGIPTVTASRKMGHYNRVAGSYRIFTAKVNSSGEFELRNLPPGPYNVSAYIGRENIAHASPVTTMDAAGTNIEGVVLTIDSGVSLTGRIRIDGEARHGLPKLYVKLLHGGVEAMYQFRIAEDRGFKIENLDANRYEVAVSGLPDGFYTKCIRMGEVDVTYSGLDVTGGAPGQVDILVSPKAGLVSGVAQNPKTSKPMPGATVVLVPAEKERLEVSASYRQATTDQYGRFAFKNVAPGEYKVYAWESVESTAWMDPDFMRPLDGKGQSVTVGERAQATVEVSVIPADSEQDKAR